MHLGLCDTAIPSLLGFICWNKMPGNTSLRVFTPRGQTLFGVFTVSDKDESCEEMSVPSSPQNEAIQHSSVSTSNGVSSSSSGPAISAPSSAATSNQSTEESQPRRVAAKSQPSGSWSSTLELLPLQSLTNRGKGFSLFGSYSFFFFFNFSLNVFRLLCFVLYRLLNAMFSLQLKKTKGQAL